MSAAIAAFSIEHLDECTQLFVDVYNAEPWNEHWRYEQARELLLETYDQVGFVGVVSFSDKLLGFAIGYCERVDVGTRFYLKEVCVRPEVQRQGVGTQLLTHLESTLKILNVTRIYLITLKDGIAEAFYTRNGYHRSPQSIVMLRHLED